MTDPRKYAGVYATIGLVIALVSGFSAARLSGLGIEEALYTVLATALPPFGIRVNEGFSDARKEPEFTRSEALDLFEVTLSNWSKRQAIPLTVEEKTDIMTDVEARLDFNDDYHFAVDGSGRHRGSRTGCTVCAVLEVG